MNLFLPHVLTTVGWCYQFLFSVSRFLIPHDVKQMVCDAFSLTSSFTTFVITFHVFLYCRLLSSFWMLFPISIVVYSLLACFSCFPCLVCTHPCFHLFGYLCHFCTDWSRFFFSSYSRYLVLLSFGWLSGFFITAFRYRYCPHELFHNHRTILFLHLPHCRFGRYPYHFF